MRDNSSPSTRSIRPPRTAVGRDSASSSLVLRDVHGARHRACNRDTFCCAETRSTATTTSRGTPCSSDAWPQHRCTPRSREGYQCSASSQPAANFSSRLKPVREVRLGEVQLRLAAPRAVHDGVDLPVQVVQAAGRVNGCNPVRARLIGHCAPRLAVQPPAVLGSADCQQGCTWTASNSVGMQPQSQASPGSRKQVRVMWPFRTKDACIELRRLYPRHDSLETVEVKRGVATL